MGTAPLSGATADTYAAANLPTWASLDATTGILTGTPPAGTAAITPITLTALANGTVIGTSTVNLIAASAGTDLAPANLSTRARVGTGAQVVTPGFVVGGNAPRTFLIRAVGPTLSEAPYNVRGTLADPTLTIFDDQQQPIAANDNWGDVADLTALTNATASAGAFGLQTGGKDAALLVTLEPGRYTAEAAGVDDATGVALLEFFDLTPPSPGSALTNLSTRAYVGTGDEVLVPGLVLNGSGTQRLLIRAIGPTLTDFNVGGALADPVMSIVRVDGASSATLATNDDWGVGNNVSAITAAAAQVGAFPLANDSRDSVLLTELPGGAYTILISGKDNTAGVALVEVYAMP